MDWPTVLSLAGLFAIGFGFVMRHMNRLEDSTSRRFDRLESKLDQLTERYITHLEHHPR